jgi:hypothetical protein
MDTLISWIEEQRPVIDTLIDTYYTDRRLSIFLGRRSAIPSSDLPSVEVSAVTDNVGWHACRVQQATPSIQIDVTIDNKDPKSSVRLQSKLVYISTTIINEPVHLLPQINGTNTHLFDSLATDVRYDQTAANGSQRVATISWGGKYLKYLENRQFQPNMQMVPPKVNFPPL